MRIQANGIKAGCDIYGNLTLTLTVPRPQRDNLNLDNLTGLLDVEIKKHREGRSLNANALFWKIVNSIAEIQDASNNEIYLSLLEDYGVQKYMVVKPEAADSITKLFRAVDDLGTVFVNGKPGRQLKCTIGSSQYDTAQMARLIRGAISESKDIGGFVPDEQDIGASLDLWKKERV